MAARYMYGVVTERWDSSGTRAEKSGSCREFYYNCCSAVTAADCDVVEEIARWKFDVRVATATEYRWALQGMQRAASSTVRPSSLGDSAKCTSLVDWSSRFTMMGDTRSSAGQCLAPHARVLRAVGFLRRRSGDARADRAHRAYHRAVLLLTAAYLLQEIVYAFRARNDMEKLSKVMFLLLCHVTSIAKQIVFYADADRIDEVLRSLDAPLLAGSSTGGAAKLARTAASARRLLTSYVGCAVVVCHLWLALTVLARVAGQPVEFSFWTGFDTHPLVAFVPCLLYSHYVITLVGIANTTMDGFMATIFFLCKTQLEILREDLRTLPERARGEGEAAGEPQETALVRAFVRCFRHYQAVTEIATSFQDIFGVAIFIQVGVGGGILCMAAYKMASLSVASAEFTAMLLFIACILTELFLYCYYGNELKVESGLVAGAAYSMRWVGLSARARRLLLLLLLRTGRELRPAAAGLVPLSLETFVKIIKSSYTFFAVLRQTK